MIFSLSMTKIIFQMLIQLHTTLSEINDWSDTVNNDQKEKELYISNNVKIIWGPMKVICHH